VISVFVGIAVEAGKLGVLIVMIMMLILLSVPLFLTQMKKLQPQDKLQRLSCLEAIDESIGRATEMGRPIMFGLGAYAKMRTGDAADTMAGLDILSYVARQAAKTETPLVASTGQSESFAALIDVTEEAYKAEGRADLFDPKNCYWWSDAWAQYYIGLTGLLFDTKPATVIFAGSVSWEAAQLSVDIHEMGGIMIGGTCRVGAGNQALMAMGSDYHIIVEEVYAASAYLSRDPIECATILAQDYNKLMFLGLLIAGIITASLGVPLITDFLTL
jgi:hypothetical protein